jgi:hypothetical protein
MTKAVKKPGPARLTLVTTPTHPIAGKPFRLRALRNDDTAAASTHARIWCLNAPLGTKVRKQIDESRARVTLVPVMHLRKVDETRQDPVELTLEKGGSYYLSIDELQIGKGYTGGYESDPRGAPSEVVKSSGIATLYVAEPLSLRLGCGPDTATLRLFIHNETVIQTELAVHGEATPRVDLSASATARARMAAENDDVRAAVAALAGQTVATLLGDISGSLDNLLTKIRAHLVQSGRHYANDTDNSIGTSFNGATTEQSRAATLNEARRLLGRHMRNDSGAGTGSAATGYHSAADWANVPLDAAAASDALTNGVAQADLWRAYEAHRLSAVHRGADNNNVATALPPLLDLHRLFLNVLAASSPPASTARTAGEAGLVAGLGFKAVDG